MPTDTPTTLVPVDDHATWMTLAEDAYRRLADEFAALGDDDWERATPCEGWTVHHLGKHLVGAMRSAASLRETASQQLAVARRVRRTGEQEVDALTAIQIERADDLRPAELAEEMRSLVGPAVRGRFRLPGVVRRAARIHVSVGAIDERWTLAYFLDCILTRDAWLHRIDLADAIGVEPRLDDADRRIVGDVAAEWARRHGQPVDLHLTGRAGGRLVVGTGGDRLEVDAVEFCRVISGRSSHPHALLRHEVPF